ncbi:hypothetical protein pb186bvf_015900 [Paramecium bursaria]
MKCQVVTREILQLYQCVFNKSSLFQLNIYQNGDISILVLNIFISQGNQASPQIYKAKYCN